MPDVYYCKDCSFWKPTEYDKNLGWCHHPFGSPELCGNYITGAHYWCGLFYGDETTRDNWTGKLGKKGG
jgi:hypothetical protein